MAARDLLAALQRSLVTAEQMKEARGWLADCGFNTVGMSDEQVLDVVERGYEGGLTGFVRDQNPGRA